MSLPRPVRFNPHSPRQAWALRRRVSGLRLCSLRSSSTAAYETDPRRPSRHHDLKSFLEYANREKLSTRAPTYTGTLYEYTVATALNRLYFDLERTGGSSDLGIDLLGRWSLPSLSRPLRALVQCKSVAGATQPSWIRELEGAFAGDAGVREGEAAVIGLLAARREATKGVRSAISKSMYPMGMMKVTADGRIEQFLWNAKLMELGLHRVSVTLRYASRSNPEPNGDVDQDEVVLLDNGKIIDRKHGRPAE